MCACVAGASSYCIVSCLNVGGYYKGDQVASHTTSIRAKKLSIAVISLIGIPLVMQSIVGVTIFEYYLTSCF